MKIIKKAKNYVNPKKTSSCTLHTRSQKLSIRTLSQNLDNFIKFLFTTDKIPFCKKKRMSIFLSLIFINKIKCNSSKNVAKKD